MLNKNTRSTRSWLAAGCSLLLCSKLITAISLNIDDPTSIRSAAGRAAYGLVSDWYHGNETGGTPGNLPAPFYWWEAGAVFMSLIDYWYYTGDDSYNNITTQAMLWQVGPNKDFMTPNQTKTTGNDDQAFWGFAAMNAAELKFPDPPEDQPQWLALAQAVFNLQTSRWDTSTCNGGLRWQVFPFNTGYDYKNTISNGCFFSLASRLYRYTGNETYHVWADRMYNWTARIGLVGQQYEAYDGSDDLLNCTEINGYRWSYNSGVMLHGAANMWNKTEDPIWKTRVNGFVASLSFFFLNGTMFETICEPYFLCNQDQQSFKAYLSRWMAATAQLCPWTASTIMPLLRKSAIGAALQCSGGSTGEVCGMAWVNGSRYDGSYGPGQQMAAMSVFLANLVESKEAPVTADTGGTSIGDPNAGSGGDMSTSLLLGRFDIDSKDRAGAWVLTSMFGLMLLGGGIWILAG